MSTQLPKVTGVTKTGDTSKQLISDIRSHSSHKTFTKQDIRRNGITVHTTNRNSIGGNQSCKESMPIPIVKVSRHLKVATDVDVVGDLLTKCSCARFASTEQR